MSFVLLVESNKESTIPKEVEHILVVKLRKHALIWWENLKRKRQCEGKSKIMT